MKSQHLNLMTCILKLNLYTILSPTQKMTLLTKLIMKMKTLNCSMNTNTILFTRATINIQSEQKATSHTNNHFNAETTSNLTTNNKIANNKIINYQQSQSLTTNSNWRNPKQNVQRKSIPKAGCNPLDKNRI